MEEERKSGLPRDRKKRIANTVLLTSASEMILLKFLNIERKKSVSSFFFFFSGRKREEEPVVFAYIAEIWMKVFSKEKNTITKKDYCILITP